MVSLSVFDQSRETYLGHSFQLDCPILKFLTINFISKSSSGSFRSHFVLYLRHVALLQDVNGLLDVVDDPLDDDVRVIDLDRVHDRLVDVHGQLEKELILFC